ncbi:MAG: mannonate dehydratase, partial [Pseudomonadota bacterium]
QAGVNYAVTKATSELSGLPAPYDRDALAAIQQRFSEFGLTLLGLEGDQFDMSRIKLGAAGRDDDLERYRRMLANMGELGLDLLCYNFMARPPGQSHDWSRTKTDVPTRGGALTSEFRLEDVPGSKSSPRASMSAKCIWDHYEYFLHAVIDSAEAAGVRMALHPDDPPIPMLSGVGRVFHEAEAFHQAYRLAPLPANAVTFCQANFMLMAGNAVEHARAFATQGRIAFVHWRDVAGSAHTFHETFHDAGPSDMAGWIDLYNELGFDGPIRVDHAPLMHGEPNPWMPGYGTLGRLLAFMYLRGVLDAKT